MKEKIVEILLDTLSYAYCDNCGTENCDDCHRKYQSWSLSRATAEYLADKILQIVGMPLQEEWKIDSDTIIQDYTQMLKQLNQMPFTCNINNVECEVKVFRPGINKNHSIVSINEEDLHEI